MHRNKTRSDLKEDIMLALGAPLIKINLTDKQIDYAINYAIRKYWRWHYEGSFENFYLYEATQADIDRGSFIVPDYFDSVVQIIPTTYLANQSNFATAQWQMTASNVLAMNRFMPLSLTDFVATQMLVTNTRLIMGEDYKAFEFVKHQRRVIPTFRWQAGDKMMLRVWEIVDPDRTDPAQVDSSLMFDDDVLRDLCIAKVKQMWGAVLERFAGATLPGGVNISGQRLIDEGNKEEEDWLQLMKDQTVDMVVIG